jgi:hypothetical protein
MGDYNGVGPYYVIDNRPDRAYQMPGETEDEYLNRIERESDQAAWANQDR